MQTCWHRLGPTCPNKLFFVKRVTGQSLAGLPSSSGNTMAIPAGAVSFKSPVASDFSGLQVSTHVSLLKTVVGSSFISSTYPLPKALPAFPCGTTFHLVHFSQNNLIVKEYFKSISVFMALYVLPTRRLREAHTNFSSPFLQQRIPIFVSTNISSHQSCWRSTACCWTCRCLNSPHTGVLSALSCRNTPHPNSDISTERAHVPAAHCTKAAS